MRMVFVRASDVLSVQRMLHPALDQHGDGLVHFVAHHLAGELPAHAGLHCRLFAHACLAFSAIMVRTRAIARRVLESSLVLVSCCVACCMRKLKCALNREVSSSLSSAALLPRSSLLSMAYPNCLATKVVAIGSLAAARRNASRAKVSSTPSIS